MKYLFVVLITVFSLSACQQSGGREQALQHQIDSLQLQVENSYKPGFGDLMGSVQIHHNKLWFAGTNENWPLAEFAMHEIEEIFEDMRVYHPDRAETQVLPMIDPALAAMHTAIDGQNSELFKEGYLTLSNTCNTCHAATNFEFIKIVVPTTPAFSNQDFNPEH